MASSSPTDTVVETALSLLDVAADIHGVAVAVHTCHTLAASDHDLPRLSTALAAAVDRLRAASAPGTGGHDLEGLVPSCVKLGLDLLVRLDRVEGSRKSEATDADLRAVWPAAAVEALADRVEGMRRGLSGFT